MSKKQSDSKNLTTPEKTAIAAQGFYDKDYDYKMGTPYRKRPVDFTMSKAEKEAFANPPFSEADMEEMQIKHNQEQLVKNMEKSEINALAPRNFDTFCRNQIHETRKRY